ncbi:A.superbus venom factor 1-like isoform X1 [Lacerta agilis]|uniref:A.superbus venom factor 1-like isoform X1 n=1 Tax=Lacerta agilis TaxID=80427 RepID=UPI001419E728|nr:A.superbus venom factor 1-like isoform X1 [Lacerta agilis]
MEGTALYLVVVLLVSFPNSSHSQLYSLITPSVLRVETEETIVVEAHEHSFSAEVTVSVYDFPQKRNTLYTVKTRMEPASGMMVTPAIKVSANDMKKDSKQNQYVIVVAECPQFTLEKTVLVSFHSGYLFIQTDKTIYTPGSKVLYRIFSVNHNMQILDKPVIVEFETPEGVVVRQSFINPTSRNFQPHPLPEIVSLGTWKIVAKYQDSPQETFTTQFDVKEYVLPSFEVIVEPSAKFYYIDSNRDFRVSITARFLYGKSVEGIAFVLFGVKMDGVKHSIPDSLQRIQISNGEGEGILRRDILQTRFHNLNNLIGHSLYVSVTVMTESGSDMVVTERSGISLVTSPYQIHFTKTPKYFKPGMPFELMVFVTNPDGSPASRVPVVTEPIAADGTTQNDGTAKLILNTPANSQELRITVKTKDPQLLNERQATKTMIATAYQTQGGSGNYLHLAVTAMELKAGDNLPINFNLKSNNQQVLNQIQYFTYMILTKGKVFKVGRQRREAGQNLVTMSLPITPDLIPSFRIVAYYQVGNTEIVADSVWMDVKDTCMGTLVVKGEHQEDDQLHEPGDQVNIKLEGDANAWVGLVAVDKGVYVLNNKYKFTQTKIWDSVEKSDIGCTAGSGRNNLGVFEDAGLALVTNNKLSTQQRSDPKCPQPARRRRRSVQLIESKASKAGQFQNRTLRKCCEDGMHENPMGYSCEKRIQYIVDQTECQNVFLECCRFIRDILNENERDEELILARSDFEDDFLADEDITSRTQFPESWLWRSEQLTAPPNDQGISSKTIPVYLKDSITTWEVLAVSISDTKGICVADPYEITVRKDFFIDLRLPYSVVRNEQVEIRAVLYNYRRRDLKVRVELIHNPAFCSASTAKEKYQQMLTIKGQSSRAVPFVVIPLKLGHHDIEVKAAALGGAADGVKKKLKVVPEGIQRKLVTVIELDPATQGNSDGVQEYQVKARSLEDIIPGTDPETKITVQGDPVAQIVEDSIDGTKLKHLIVTPSGCGEQNMITMTPSVIATHYLDTTGQWEKLGVDRRSDAVNQIMQGYTQQMTYKKEDHSYAAFKNRKSSTWLTAYVIKIFAMASGIVSSVDNRILCGGVKWLILEKQKPDGIFHEDAPMIHGEMQGGYKGAEPEVSLTAFVLIALLESKDICKDQVNILESSINKASEYLLRQYETLQRPYTVALTAYALALAGRLNDDGVLMAASRGKNRWEEYKAHTYNIEGTSYALLALLKMRKFDAVGAIVKWLTKQKHYGGTYGQTQATVMVFQALAQYEIDIPTHKEIRLAVSIKLPERREMITFPIDYDSALLVRSAETKLNKDFIVKASGEGKAIMTIVTVYNAKLQEGAEQCKSFYLQVSVENVQLIGRQAKGAKGAVRIKICTRYLGKVDATMSIIDVSMLTGFAPDTEDLKRLSEGVDRYISKFDINDAMSERGNLIIYLDKVSHTEEECLQFKAYKYFEVGLIQPGSVKVYSYYNLDEQCTKFYHPSKGSGLLDKICHGEVCRCAEDNCFLQNDEDNPVDVHARIEAACKPGVDYVYKTKLSHIEEENDYNNYFMEVLEVIKAGSDANPEAKPRLFISHKRCNESLNLVVNKDYLIWSLNSDLWQTKTDFNYMISKDTWIEKWPNDDECQDEEFHDLCNDLTEFSNTLITFGCNT